MSVSVEEFGKRVGEFLVKHVAPSTGDDLMRFGIGFVANSMVVQNLLNHPMAGLLGVIDGEGHVNLQALHKSVIGAFECSTVLDLTRFGVTGKGLAREDAEIFFRDYCPIDTADTKEK